MAICRNRRSRFFVFLPVIFLVPILLSVRELQQKLINDVPKRNAAKKSNQLLLGPAAGQGLPNRLQCDGLAAMNKRPLPSLQLITDTREIVSFVSMFTMFNSTQSPVLMNDNPISKVTIGNTSYNKTERSIAILHTFIDFIQISMPRSNAFILTDPMSKDSVNRKNVTLFPIQGDFSRGKLMLQRIRSYIIFLEARLRKQSEWPKSINHYILCDSDVAVVGDLGHIFRDFPDFHLALTFRNNKEQPLNSGFIAVRGTTNGILKSKIFLEQVLEVYSSKFINASRMLGDQLALAWFVRSFLPFTTELFRRPEAFSGEVNGASVLFLPCAVYNWTPPEGAGQFHGMPLDIQVVHFKGSRKRLMLEAWNFYNKTSSLPDMLCLILKSGRTKYDF